MLFYNNHGIELYCGDALEESINILDNSIDAVVCDPPYGITGCDFDKVVPFDKMWEMIHRVCKPNAPVILFASQPFTCDLINSNRKEFKYELIWKKNVPTGMSLAKYRPMKYHETILVFHTNSSSTYNPIMKPRVGIGKDCYRYDHYCGSNNHLKDMKKVKKKYDPDFVQPSSILDFNVVPNRNGKLHPTQKPVDLMEYLIKTYTNENDVILDFTAGSGSTGIAAMNVDRKCILIEKEENYCNIILNRIEDEFLCINQKIF